VSAAEPVASSGKSSSGGKSSSTAEHDDHGHGNDVGKVDYDNPALVKHTSSTGSDGDHGAADAFEDVFFDSGKGVADDGHDWVSAVNSDNALGSGDQGPSDWVGSVVNSNQNQGEDGYDNLTKEHGAAENGEGHGMPFDAVDHFA
jgi:hypothetical protein